MQFSAMWGGGKHKRIYLDHAAATPVRTEVLEAIAPFFSVHFGNASAIHEEGRTAKAAVESARECIADVLHIRAEGVYFTANGTESNNLALYGSLRRLTEDAGVALSEVSVISTKIEHPSIMRVLEHLESQGVDVRYVDVDAEGFIDERHLASLLSPKTALVTFGYANSEIGVVQDVKRISRIIKKYNLEHDATILTHLDAAQAPLWLPCRLDMLGVDMISLDAGKCGGPKGIGVLAVRHGVKLKGVVLGGGQERGLRAGTENTPLIVGASCAIELAAKEYASRSAAVAALRDAMIERLFSSIPDIFLNGPREMRIANNVNVSIPGVDSEFAVVTLDTKGIATSTKSACSGANGNGSSVVRVITSDEARARSTIRFTLGPETTLQDIERTVSVLEEHVTKTRAFEETLT